MSARPGSSRGTAALVHRLAPALVMLPAGPVWQLLGDGGGWAPLGGQIFFLLSLAVGAIGAVVAGALTTIVASQTRLAVAALVLEAVILVTLVAFPGVGDRAFLSVAEAAVRTGACVALLLGPLGRDGEAAERALLDRGRWAAGGLMLGVVAAELASPPVHAGMLAACGAALCVLSLAIAWAGALTLETRRLADGLGHERA